MSACIRLNIDSVGVLVLITVIKGNIDSPIPEVCEDFECKVKALLWNVMEGPIIRIGLMKVLVATN